MDAVLAAEHGWTGGALTGTELPRDAASPFPPLPLSGLQDLGWSPRPQRVDSDIGPNHFHLRPQPARCGRDGRPPADRLSVPISGELKDSFQPIPGRKMISGTQGTASLPLQLTIRIARGCLSLSAFLWPGSPLFKGV